MNNDIEISRAKYTVGDLIHHRLFDYRGVIVDVDPKFQSTDTWYETMAKSRPPKNKPWYHVLVHGAVHTTYVAEQNLKLDSNAAPITHPMLKHIFSDFKDGRYVKSSHRTN